MVHHRRGPVPRKGSTGLRSEVRRYRTAPILILIIGVVTLMVLSSILALLLWNPLVSADVEVTNIDIEIEGDVCNLSVSLVVDPPLGRPGSKIYVEHGNGTESLVFDDGKATGSVTEAAFRSMIQDGVVDIKGSVEMGFLHSLGFDHEVRTSFDISSIAGSLKDLEVSNVTVTPTLRGYMIVGMDLGSKVDERVGLEIRTTKADLALSTGTYKATVDELVLDGSTGKGNCVISIPTAAVLTLTFLERSVSFECFGIAGSFVLPQ